jgi:hypothetical protein
LKAEEDLLKMRQELDALKKQIDAQNAKKP